MCLNFPSACPLKLLLRFLICPQRRCGGNCLVIKNLLALPPLALALLPLLPHPLLALALHLLLQVSLRLCRLVLPPPLPP